MHFTTVKKLYKGEYKYNIVLRLWNGDIFRGKDKRKYTREFNYTMNQGIKPNWKHITAELGFLPQIYEYIMAMDEFATRFEQPRLHVYTNNYGDILGLMNLVPNDALVSVGLPAEGLEKGMVYMPDTPYEFRVTLGSITTINTEFVEWAEGNKNVRLQPRTKSNLVSPGIYNSGTQLYVTGERNLLFVRLHLGNVNLTVERILN